MENVVKTGAFMLYCSVAYKCATAITTTVVFSNCYVKGSQSNSHQALLTSHKDTTFCKSCLSLSLFKQLEAKPEETSGFLLCLDHLLLTGVKVGKLMDVKLDCGLSAGLQATAA